MTFTSRWRYLSDGEPIVFFDGIAWGSGQPDNWDNQEHFATVSTSAHTLNDIGWWYMYPYACEWRTGPHYDWEHVEEGLDLNYLYGFHDLETSATFCDDNGGRLVEPRSAEQLAKVVEAAKDVGLFRVWLGVIKQDDK